MRKIILIGAVVLAVPAVLLLRYAGDNNPQRVLRRLNDTGVLVRRSCGAGEAYVDAARWRDLSARNQERAASALAAWCLEQGGTNTITLIDSNSRATIARWNGTTLESDNRQ